jgi:hypothetical protein
MPDAAIGGAGGQPAGAEDPPLLDDDDELPPLVGADEPEEEEAAGAAEEGGGEVEGDDEVGGDQDANVLPEAGEAAGDAEEGGGEIEGDDWEEVGGEHVSKVIGVYAGVLEDLRDSLEQLGNTALYLTALDKALAQIAELQDGSRQQADAYIARTHRLLQRWCFLPAEHPLHRLEKDYKHIIGERRLKVGLCKQPRKRWAGWKNPLPPRDAAEANRVIYGVIMKIMEMLAGLCSRGCIEYHLVVINKYKGNMQLSGESKGLQGLSELLGLRVCVDAFMRLRTQQQRVAGLSSIRGVNYDKLDVLEKRPALKVVLDVVAQGRQQACPFRPGRPASEGPDQQQPTAAAAAEQAKLAAEQAKAAAEKAQGVWSAQYFEWPVGLPFVSPGNQTEAGLVQLFDAAVAAVGDRWPQVLFQAQKTLQSTPGCDRIVDALRAAEVREAARATAARLPDAELDDSGAAGLRGDEGGDQVPPHEDAVDDVAGTLSTCWRRSLRTLDLSERSVLTPLIPAVVDSCGTPCARIVPGCPCCGCRGALCLSSA